nr:class I tRNA ligase family protein [Sporomusaceae bacterium]
ALLRLEQVRAKVTEAYEEYEFHTLYHTVHNFCTVDLSSIYLDILKDRLYAEGKTSVQRRAAQTAMYEIMVSLLTMLAPVLSFTAEEVWRYVPKTEDMPESIQMTTWPTAKPEYIDNALAEKWDAILALRSEITKGLEAARRAKTIGHSLDAAITIYAKGDAYKVLESCGADLAGILIVSKVSVEEGDTTDEAAFVSAEADLKMVVAAATGEKCERCWIYSDSVGESADHPTLCSRCASVVK